MSHYTYIHIFFFLSLCKSPSFLPLIFPILFPFTHSPLPFFPATTALFLALLPSYLTILFPSLLPGSTFFILPTLTPLPLTLNCPSITPPFLIVCQKYCNVLIYFTLHPKQLMSPLLPPHFPFFPLRLSLLSFPKCQFSFSGCQRLPRLLRGLNIVNIHFSHLNGLSSEEKKTIVGGLKQNVENVYWEIHYFFGKKKEKNYAFL